jgi:hypothetical protein
MERTRADPVAAVRTTAEDYLFSWLDGDRGRMEGCLHPALAKRSLADDARASIDLFDLSKEYMVERASEPKPFGREAQIDVRAIDGEIASASVRSEPFLDLLHLARFGGRWLIVNALWAEAPIAPATPQAEAGVRAALEDYAAFPFARDVERARRCHHPDLRERRPLSRGGPDLALEETSFDEVLAVAASGFGEEPASREPATDILDLTADLASARMDIAWFQIHLHLAAFLDGWRIVNILYRTKDDG